MTRSYLINRRCSCQTRANTVSEPRERSEPAKRRAREREGGSGGAKPPDETSVEVVRPRERARTEGNADGSGRSSRLCVLTAQILRTDAGHHAIALHSTSR
jgi:hypothetical protein